MTEEITFDPFAVMTQKVKENEDSKGGSGNYEGGSIEQPEWYPLQEHTYTPFRIVGNPFEARTEPWHAKLIMVSEILTDNGYAIPFIWPSEKDEFGMDVPKIDTDYFLFRLYKAISKGKWDENLENPKTGKKGMKVYEYIHTDAGKRILNNYTAEEEERANKHKFSMNRPFLPKPRVIIPVYVANDSFCIDKKHTRLLTTKHKKWEVNGKSGFNTDLGVPYNGFYTLLNDKVVAFHNHWDIDVLGYKNPNGPKEGKHAYEVADASDTKIVQKYGLDVSTERLDPEFVASLNHYNLDEMIQFKVSSYHKIQKHLIKAVKLVDTTLDTTFEEELKDLVAEEKARWEAEKKDKESKSINTVQKPEVTTTQEPESVNDGPVVEAPKARQRQPVQTESKEVEWTEETIRAKCAEIYKYWEDLDNREKDAMIRGIIRFENDIPVIDPDMVTKGTYQMCGDDCKYKDGSFVMTEESISKCPACGTGYK